MADPQWDEWEWKRPLKSTERVNTDVLDSKNYEYKYGECGRWFNLMVLFRCITCVELGSSHNLYCTDDFENCYICGVVLCLNHGHEVNDECRCDVCKEIKDIE